MHIDKYKDKEVDCVDYKPSWLSGCCKKWKTCKNRNFNSLRNRYYSMAQFICIGNIVAFPWFDSVSCVCDERYGCDGMSSNRRTHMDNQVKVFADTSESGKIKKEFIITLNSAIGHKTIEELECENRLYLESLKTKYEPKKERRNK